jgi:hypothetical protein
MMTDEEKKGFLKRMGYSGKLPGQEESTPEVAEEVKKRGRKRLDTNDVFFLKSVFNQPPKTQKRKDQSQ